MRGGHNIKSKKDKELLGTSRADRDDNRLENFTTALDVVPPAPSHFKAKVRRKWVELATELVKLKVLTEADLGTLAILCQNLVLCEEAYEEVLEKGTTIEIVTETTSRTIVNPMFRVYLDTQKVAKPMLEQFGLTPRARQSLKVQQPEQEDPLADLLKPKKPSEAAPKH